MEVSIQKQKAHKTALSLADLEFSSPHRAVLCSGSYKGVGNTPVFWLLLGIPWKQRSLKPFPHYKHPHSRRMRTPASEGLCVSLVLLIQATSLRTSNSKVYWFSVLKMKKLLQEANDQQD